MAYSYQNSFIQSLSLTEKSIIESHLRKDLNNEDKEKFTILFRTLINEPNRNFSDFELEKITGSYGNALRTMKSRLFDKATEALIHDRYIQDQTIFNALDRNVFQVRKKFLVVKIIYKSNHTENTRIISELLNQVIKTSKEYEIFDVLVEALYFKKRINSFYKNISETKSIEKEILFYENCLSALNYGHSCFYTISLHVYQPTLLAGNRITKLLLNSIRQLKKYYSETKSAYVKFYMLIAEFALAEHKKEYHEALSICKKLKTFVEKTKAIYLVQRIGLVQSNLSLYYMLLQKPQKAREHILLAQNCYPKNAGNQFKCFEQEFYVEFYDKKYDFSKLVLKKLLAQELTEAGHFQKSKYDFFHAWLLFAKKQSKEALQILVQPFELEKEKTLWSVGLKILLTQTYIELNKLDEASRTIESLRKHIDRHGKGGKIKKRDILNLRTLKAYEKEGFNYPLGNKAIPKLLKTLAQKNKPHSWEFRTPEMIPFHEWLENR